MRVLLDECVDIRLGPELVGHDVRNVAEMGWSGRQNGELLQSAAAQFDAFVTVARDHSYQQNLSRYDIAVLVLRARRNRLADLRKLIPAIQAALPTALKRQATVVV